MALFFNLKNLESESQNNAEKLVCLLRYHHQGVTVVNKYAKYKPSKSSLKGTSFILCPRPVLYGENIEIAYLSQYIKLCGRRDWLLYKTHKFAGLDTSFYPDLLVENIKTNPLLKISNKLIYFKFEEIYCGSKIW